MEALREFTVAMMGGLGVAACVYIDEKRDMCIGGFKYNYIFPSSFLIPIVILLNTEYITQSCH